MTQHLTALSKDEWLAPYVNLVPLDVPGDLYNFIAGKVWGRLDQLVEATPQTVKDQFDEVFNHLDLLQRKYDEAQAGTDLKAAAWEELQTYRNNKRRLREQMFPIFWAKVTEKKLRRKIAKRPSMSISYGATRYGLGQQTWDDTRPLSPWLHRQEKLWSSMFGDLIYDVSRKELSGPGRLLTLFETLADRYNDRQEAMAWKSPITNFPVIQNYRKPVSERTKLKHGDQILDVVVESWDTSILDKDSQKLGASPNIVHSLDATHMCMVLNSVDFPMAAIHDSFGCTAGNMSTLFRVVREKFVELYDTDPLKYILDQLDCSDMLPERGNLDLTQVLESDFCFC